MAGAPVFREFETRGFLICVCFWPGTRLCLPPAWKQLEQAALVLRSCLRCRCETNCQGPECRVSCLQERLGLTAAKQSNLGVGF